MSDREHSRMIIANDLPYIEGGPETPMDALRNVLAFSVDDWGSTRAMAWVWGIVCGWDDADPEASAMAELAAKFQWNAETVANLRRLHEAFDALDG